MDVCVKIIKNNKDFFDQSLDEIKLLKFINKNDPGDKYHILRLYDYFYYRVSPIYLAYYQLYLSFLHVVHDMLLCDLDSPLIKEYRVKLFSFSRQLLLMGYGSASVGLRYLFTAWSVISNSGLEILNKPANICRAVLL